MENSLTPAAQCDAPVITTIIPTYRRPAMLRRAILSVLNQTHPHFIVCVYDNASDDNTAALVAELAAKDKRVQYYCHPENIGAGRNFQFGYSRVRTPYFSFLSDDDILLPEFYEKALAHFQKYPRSRFVIGTVLFAGEKAVLCTSSTVNFRKGYYEPAEGQFTAARYGYPPWTGILFSSRTLDEVGDLDVTILNIDVDFLMRCFSTCPFVIISDVVAVFSRHSDTMFCTSKLADLIYPDIFEIIRNFEANERFPEVMRRKIGRQLRNYWTKMLIRFTINAMRNGDNEEAERILKIIRQHLRRPVVAGMTGVAGLLVKRRFGYAFLRSLYMVLRSVYHARRASVQTNVDYSSELQYYQQLSLK